MYGINVETKQKVNFIETGSRMVVARDWEAGWKIKGDVDQRVKTFSYKINKF